MQQKVNRSYKIIGLMSGTSLDGLDICCANYSLSESNSWSFEINATQFITYPSDLLKKMQHATTLSGLDLMLLDKNLGIFYGEKVKKFLQEKNIDVSSIDAIASHGQTIFHQPEIGFTCQIGCGQSIASIAGIKTINDFRKKDVLYGGQGAPLVPIGDKLLFSSFADAFLNIGGFANMTKIDSQNRVVAFDICPANIAINHYTQQLSLAFDKDGAIAKNANVDTSLLKQLNELDIYKQQQPHSLGWEWVEASILPLVEATQLSVEERIATLTEHAAYQIAQRLNDTASQNVFVTGGGAKNQFLMERLAHYFTGNVVVPSSEIIDFKEALIFGFLGALFLENTPNCLPEVTGATKAVVGGVLYHP